MRPIKTDDCNVVLTLPGGTSENDLHAQRCEFVDPTDKVQRPPQPGFESTWLPDEREREAIGAGAPIMLRVWGTGHPPVNLAVPAIDTDRMAITADHAARAVGALYALLEDGDWFEQSPVLTTEEQGTTAPAFLDLWARAVEATSHATAQAGAMIDQLVEEAEAAASTGDTSPGPERDPIDQARIDHAKRTAPHGDPFNIPCAGCDARAGEPCKSRGIWVPTVGDRCDRQAAQARGGE